MSLVLSREIKVLMIEDSKDDTLLLALKLIGPWLPRLAAQQFEVARRRAGS